MPRSSVILGNVRNPIHKACFALIYACGLRISEGRHTRSHCHRQSQRALAESSARVTRNASCRLPRPVHDGLRQNVEGAPQSALGSFPNSWGTGPAQHQRPGQEPLPMPLRRPTCPISAGDTPIPCGISYATRLFEKKVDTPRHPAASRPPEPSPRRAIYTHLTEPARASLHQLLDNN